MSESQASSIIVFSLFLQKLIEEVPLGQSIPRRRKYRVILLFRIAQGRPSSMLWAALIIKIINLLVNFTAEFVFLCYKKHI